MRRVAAAVAVLLLATLVAGCAEDEATRKAWEDCEDFVKAERVAGLIGSDQMEDHLLACFKERLKFYDD